MAGTETRINVERQRYNSAVQAYNTTIRRMPTALVARLSNFTPRSSFEADKYAATAPAVQCKLGGLLNCRYASFSVWQQFEDAKRTSICYITTVKATQCGDSDGGGAPGGKGS